MTITTTPTQHLEPGTLVLTEHGYYLILAPELGVDVAPGHILARRAERPQQHPHEIPENDIVRVVDEGSAER